jgi:hypothetical protein
MAAGWRRNGDETATKRRRGGDETAVEQRRNGDGVLAALNAIPLGMERSVEKHPHHRNRHSVGMPPEYLWTHS